MVARRGLALFLDMNEMNGTRAPHDLFVRLMPLGCPLRSLTSSIFDESDWLFCHEEQEHLSLLNTDKSTGKYQAEPHQ